MANKKQGETDLQIGMSIGESIAKFANLKQEKSTKDKQDGIFSKNKPSDDDKKDDKDKDKKSKDEDNDKQDDDKSSSDAKAFETGVGIRFGGQTAAQIIHDVMLKLVLADNSLNVSSGLVDLSYRYMLDGQQVALRDLIRVAIPDNAEEWIINGNKYGIFNPDESMMIDPMQYMQYNGSLLNYIKDLSNSPFNEVYWTYEEDSAWPDAVDKEQLDAAYNVYGLTPVNPYENNVGKFNAPKATMHVRMTPFEPTSWFNLETKTVEPNQIIEIDYSKNDADQQSVFSITSSNEELDDVKIVPPVTDDQHELERKYGYNMKKEVTSDYFTYSKSNLMLPPGVREQISAQNNEDDRTGVAGISYPSFESFCMYFKVDKDKADDHDTDPLPISSIDGGDDLFMQVIQISLKYAKVKAGFYTQYNKEDEWNRKNNEVLKDKYKNNPDMLYQLAREQRELSRKREKELMRYSQAQQMEIINLPSNQSSYVDSNGNYVVVPNKKVITVETARTLISQIDNVLLGITDDQRKDSNGNTNDVKVNMDWANKYKYPISKIAYLAAIAPMWEVPQGISLLGTQSTGKLYYALADTAQKDKSSGSSEDSTKDPYRRAADIINLSGHKIGQEQAYQLASLSMNGVINRQQYISIMNGVSYSTTNNKVSRALEGMGMDGSGYKNDGTFDNVSRKMQYQNRLFNFFADNSKFFSGSVTVQGQLGYENGKRLIVYDRTRFRVIEAYIESVSHHFDIQSFQWTTTIGFTRGLKFDWDTASEPLHDDENGTYHVTTSNENGNGIGSIVMGDFWNRFNGYWGHGAPFVGGLFGEQPLNSIIDQAKARNAANGDSSESKSGSGSADGGDWGKPFDDYVAPTGLELFGAPRSGGSHDGCDFSGGSGKKIKAIHGGKVVQAGVPDNKSLAQYVGQVIVTKASDGYYVGYQEFGATPGHGGSIKVKVGDTVKAGDVIATDGSVDGDGVGTYVHIGVTKKDEPYKKGSSLNYMSTESWEDPLKLIH